MDHWCEFRMLSEKRKWTTRARPTELSQLMSQILQDHFHRAKRLAWFQTTQPWCRSNLNWRFDSVCLLSLKAETLAYDSVCSTTSRCSIFQGRGYWELLIPKTVFFLPLNYVKILGTIVIFCFEWTLFENNGLGGWGVAGGGMPSHKKKKKKKIILG